MALRLLVIHPAGKQKSSVDALKHNLSKGQTDIKTKADANFTTNFHRRRQ